MDVHDWEEVEILLSRADRIRAEELQAVINNAAVASNNPLRLGDDPTVTDAAREYDEFMAEATPRSLHFGVNPLRRSRFRELVTEHPPREGVTEDQVAGLNVDTAGETLLREAKWGLWIPEGGEVPDHGTPDEREAWVESLKDGVFFRLVLAAAKANTDGGPDPKLRLSSRLVRSSERTSTSPSRLGSP